MNVMLTQTRYSRVWMFFFGLAKCHVDNDDDESLTKKMDSQINDGGVEKKKISIRVVSTSFFDWHHRHEQKWGDLDWNWMRLLSEHFNNQTLNQHIIHINFLSPYNYGYGWISSEADVHNTYVATIRAKDEIIPF